MAGFWGEPDADHRHGNSLHAARFTFRLSPRAPVAVALRP
jgi:hypothetical protein